jgi:hypothetical protein
MWSTRYKEPVLAGNCGAAQEALQLASRFCPVTVEIHDLCMPAVEDHKSVSITDQ